MMLYSVYDEERNRLRLRAWEQRNQETSQAKELGAENVPLFGQPYKVCAFRCLYFAVSDPISTLNSIFLQLIL